MGARWTEFELEILKKIYPTESKEKILQKINKTWSSIQAKAYKLEIKRIVDRKEIAKKNKQKKNTPFSISKKKLKELLEKSSNIESIAKKLRTDEDTIRNFIYKYDL